MSKSAVSRPKHLELEVSFPDVAGLSQEEEWCWVQVNGKPEKIRFHDYARIFQVPGLYEELFYGRLECNSPKTLVGLLGEELKKAEVAPASLHGLDLGAGNGMVGEELRALGVGSLIGVDILPDARLAAERDRPGVYRDYVVADLTRLSDEQRRRLQTPQANLLSTVAALGFGDMPAQAFATAWNLSASPSWVMFNIKEEFLSQQYVHGFALLVRKLTEHGLLELKVQKAYRHRLALDGRGLNYVGLVGVKRGPVPDEWVVEDER